MVARHNLPASVIAAIVALFGIAVSALSLTAAMIALPASATVDSLRKGNAAPEESIREAAELSLRAGRLFERARYFSDASLAIGRLDQSARSSVLDATSQQAIIEDALKSAPMSPHNWARRAAVQLAKGDVKGARASLATSLMVGRFMPGLTVPRLRLMLDLLRRAPDAELERRFEEQVRIAARAEPARLANFADGGAAEGKTQRILAAEPVLYAAYLKALNEQRAARAARKDDVER
jgi:hypothetical protein